MSQPVAVPGPPSTVVGSAITLDAEQVTTRFLRIDDGEIDEEAPRSDLVMDLVTVVSQSPGDLILERRVGL